MRRRADQVAATRRRIVEAAVELHGSVGPARTTVAAIADRAGVTRLTVYRHFPDDAALFGACSAHWLSGQPLPDPRAWASIAEPVDRLRAGLADIYRFYRSGAQMLANVYRDFADLPEGLRRQLWDTDRAYREALAGPFAGDPPTRRRVWALIGHAVSFWAWRSLCVEEGLSDEEAVEAMTALVAAATRPVGTARP